MTVENTHVKKSLLRTTGSCNTLYHFLSALLPHIIWLIRWASYHPQYKVVTWPRNRHHIHSVEQCFSSQWIHKGRYWYAENPMLVQ